MREDVLTRELFADCRNVLLEHFPYLNGAFGKLPVLQSDRSATVGTDGQSLFCRPSFAIGLYAEDPARLRRGYLHILLHCLFLHPFRHQQTELWGLACDMAVERILDRENCPRLKIEKSPVRVECDRILEQYPAAAEGILLLLRENRFPFSQTQLEEAYGFDDHSLWHASGPEGQGKWDELLNHALGTRKGCGSPGTRSGTDQENFEDIRASRDHYRSYLQRFTVPGEEMELDMDSFDYIYYTLGMEQYGNMPLLEPLEYREGCRLEQLVIAVDTSGSCSRETVQEFLRETYAILSRRENFFRRMQVYLIQCDCLVQSVAQIRSREEWMNYSREITVRGRGGTDFTPVFRYVEQLQSRGKLKKLRGLLYFTDGDGCYPREKPPYETGFVFLTPNEHMAQVPEWATVLTAEDR